MNASEIDLLIRNNDLDTLKKHRDSVVQHIYIACSFAVVYNKIDILTYLDTLQIHHRRHAILRYNFGIACIRQNLEIVIWCMQRMSSAELYPADTCYIRNVDILEHLVSTGWHPTQETVEVAALKNNGVLVRWMFERGIILSAAPKARYTHEMLDVLHEYGILGEYTKECTSECKWCKREQVKDMWVMESEEYEGVLQWLPREMLFDTLSIAF